MRRSRPAHARKGRSHLRECDAPIFNPTAEGGVVEGDFMRSSKKWTRYVTGAALALFMATVFAGCADSDEFEYMKSERQMMRHGDYGPGMSDADRQKLQESYASKQLSKVTPTSGAAAP